MVGEFLLGTALATLVILGACFRPRKAVDNRVNAAKRPPLFGGLAHNCTILLHDSLHFYRCIWYFWRGGSFEHCPFFPESVQARCQVYSLVLVFYLWGRPHYRSGTFQDDMKKNLRNVALPRTGLPLSLFCCFRPLAWAWLLFVYPLVCLVAAIRSAVADGANIAEAFREQLLTPQDWFSFWRLNCRLASYHSMLTGSKGYAMEDKWTFLTEAKSAGVPVSPWLDASQIGSICVKDKNEEGGMGIHFFKNAAAGGDWIIQEKLSNAQSIASLLPDSAPLSTFRVISASHASLQVNKGKPISEDSIECLSTVFRAGLANKATDHSSILFDVDQKSGRISKGTTNAHWYKLGLRGLRSAWTSEHCHSVHPDSGTAITGTQVDQMPQMLQLVRQAHAKLLPDVPMAGWDVAFTDKGMLLLEVNLSCNFFRGSFDQARYFDFVAAHFKELQVLQQRSAEAKAKTA